MPERGFQSGTWTDPWFQKLGQEQKFLFIYLWTNDHCNQAGLYEITLETIAFDTKLPVDDLPALLDSLRPKVEWCLEDNLVWVRNFLRHQLKSPKFLIAAARCLQSIRNNGLIKEFLEYNHTLSIPYQYSSGSVPIPPNANASANASANAKGIGVVKGEGEPEVEMIKIMGTLNGWQVDQEDVNWLRAFRGQFPAFALDDLRACIDYHSGRVPPKEIHKGIWKNRFRHWMVKKREFEKEAKVGEQQPRKGVRPKPDQERRRPITRIPGD